MTDKEKKAMDFLRSKGYRIQNTKPPEILYLIRAWYGHKVHDYVRRTPGNNGNYKSFKNMDKVEVAEIDLRTLKFKTISPQQSDTIPEDGK